MTKDSEFKKFDEAMTSLLKVPHSKIKAKLDAEREEKKKRPKRMPKTSRSESGS
jgi:hypothetical protein